jgi:hypothetical protein
MRGTRTNEEYLGMRWMKSRHREELLGVGRLGRRVIIFCRRQSRLVAVFPWEKIRQGSSGYLGLIGTGREAWRSFGKLVVVVVGVSNGEVVAYCNLKIEANMSNSRGCRHSSRMMLI